ncbi:MAG: hypothetical protein J0H62_06680 [Rhizobiales bacterium]|nr:hypothetical protein [Hyphomicrobiales bacterium]
MSVILDWALMAIQVLFCIGAIGVFAEFNHGKDIRNLLASCTFAAATVASYRLNAWWPLFVGFGVLWIFKSLGLDPSDDRP